MEAFIKKLTKVLQQSFPKSELELEEVGSGRVGGLIVWDRFAKLDHVDRQKRLSDVIKSKISPKEQLLISAILAMTPAEMANARR